MSSFRALRAEQLEGMSKLGDGLLQGGICIIPSALGSSYFYIRLSRNPAKLWADPRLYRAKAHVFLCVFSR